MPRFRVTFAILDTLEAEVETDTDDPSIGDLIEAAHLSPYVMLPSIEAEITDALWWEKVA